MPIHLKGESEVHIFGHIVTIRFRFAPSAVAAAARYLEHFTANLPKTDATTATARAAFGTVASPAALWARFLPSRQPGAIAPPALLIFENYFVSF
jgi:hypothetical protein